jgi:hypothetical protein
MKKKEKVKSVESLIDTQNTSMPIKLALNKEMISNLNFHQLIEIEGEGDRKWGSSARGNICICGPTAGPVLCPTEKSRCCYD